MDRNESFDESVREMSISDAMGEAVASNLPFAHRMYKEIHNLREKLFEANRTVPRSQPRLG